MLVTQKKVLKYEDSFSTSACSGKTGDTEDTSSLKLYGLTDSRKQAID